MPARFWAVRRALRSFGIKDERAAKGSHVVVRDAQGRTYTIPAHHGDKTELSDVYLRALCRKFDIDFGEFKKRC